MAAGGPGLLVPRIEVHGPGAAHDDTDMSLRPGDSQGSFEIYLQLLMKEHDELRNECALLRAHVKHGQTAEHLGTPSSPGALARLGPDSGDRHDGTGNATEEVADAGLFGETLASGQACGSADAEIDSPDAEIPESRSSWMRVWEDTGRSAFTKAKMVKYMEKYRSVSHAGGAGLFHFKGAKELKRKMKWVRQPRFSFVITGVIVLNAISIAVYTSVALRETRQSGKTDVDHKEMWILGDTIFAAIFVSELVLRICAYQVKFFKGSQNLWNAFDCLTLLATLIALISDIARAPPNFYVNFFKMLRLARLVRSVNASKSPYLHTLKTLMYTVAGSANAFLSAIVLLVIVISVFGVMFMQGLQNYLSTYQPNPVDPGEGQDTRKSLETHFGTFHDSAYTLFACITGGIEWDTLAPALEEIGTLYKYFLVVYIMFAVLCVLNILNGVFVNAAIESAHSNKELAVAKTHHKMMAMIEQAVKWFVEADKDGSGKLSWEELRDIMGDDEVRAFLSANGIDVVSAWKIFKLLDADGSGALAPEEFVDNLITLQGNAKALDLASLRVVCEQISERVSSVEVALRGHAPGLSRRTAAVSHQPAGDERRTPISPPVSL